MPKKTAVNESAAATSVRAAKPKTLKTVKTAPVVEIASKPRVRTVKHSKVAATAASEVVILNAHEQIAKIAYGYWESRGCEHGFAEQDWLRAEQEYLLSA